MFKCYDGMKFEGASERLVTCNIVPPVSILLFTYPCKLHDFSKQLFCNTLLLERLKSVNLSCKTAVKKNKGKYENGWITKARSTTNFWLSENYFPQNLWSWCEAQSDLCVWWFNVDIFQFQKLQWPWIRRPPGKWWIFAAKRLSVRVAAGGIKVSDTGISVHFPLHAIFCIASFCPFCAKIIFIVLQLSGVHQIKMCQWPDTPLLLAATGCWLKRAISKRWKWGRGRNFICGVAESLLCIIILTPPGSFSLNYLLAGRRSTSRNCCLSSFCLQPRLCLNSGVFSEKEVQRLHAGKVRPPE